MLSNFKKVIVWGHKLDSARTANTFAFIHDSWMKTFKYLGAETLWFDNTDDVSNFDFDNCLFLTEGQVDQNLPINKTCKYVLHNCNLAKYQSVLPNVLNLQVYTHDCLSRKVNLVSPEQYCYYQPEADFSRPDHGCDNRTIYQPWATNLLPDEIDVNKLVEEVPPKMNKVFWVGSIMGGPHRNDDKILEMKQALAKHNIEFIHAKLENNMQPRAIRESFIAPAIQGEWQVTKGYIPCRVFKNISYGRMTGTNSSTVMNLMNNKLIYSDSVEQLVNKSIEWEKNPNKEVLREIIENVKSNHTFVNRINNILKVL